MQVLATTLTALATVALAQVSTAQIGTTYCAANPNSTGGISLISATGSTSVGMNDVTLACSNLPQNAFGYFLTSQTQAVVLNPGGSSGNLCIGGNIGRYAGNVLSSGTTGSVSLAIDLLSVPAPMGSYSAMPGDTLNFQFWHRDAGTMGVTSNFSEGLEIAFDAPQGPTFSLDVWPLFEAPSVGMGPSCVDCHASGFGGLFMTDVTSAYANLVGVQSGSGCTPRTYVIPGDVPQSLLYEKLLPSPSCGGQMPAFNVFAGDTNVIRDWILAGAAF